MTAGPGLKAGFRPRISLGLALLLFSACGGMRDGGTVGGEGIESAVRSGRSVSGEDCQYCHVDVYQDWQLSAHFEAGVSCQNRWCHGTSMGHMDAEDNSVKPEVYYSGVGKQAGPGLRFLP